MEYNKKTAALKERVADLRRMLDNAEDDLMQHQRLIPLSPHELMLLLGRIHSIKDLRDNDFILKVYQDDYEHILGGDDRSRPWSEKRTGTICSFYTPYFFTDDQRAQVSAYLHSLSKIDKLNIVSISDLSKIPPR